LSAAKIIKIGLKERKSWKEYSLGGSNRFGTNGTIGTMGTAEKICILLKLND
jgi:hypothetical protein